MGENQIDESSAGEEQSDPVAVKSTCGNWRSHGLPDERECSGSCGLESGHAGLHQCQTGHEWEGE